LEIDGSTSRQISKARIEQAQRNRFQTIAGIAILLGASQFLLVNTIAESLYPSYSVKDQALSELGVGQVALMWNASLFFVGVSVVLEDTLSIDHWEAD
jgi:hypothetical membrane protein